MLAGELLREAVGLCVDDVIHIALAVERDILGAVLGDRREPHQAEGPVKFRRIRMREFHEFETVGPHRVGGCDGGWRSVEGEGSHGRLLTRMNVRE
jgi:hypothetical protein